MSRIALMLFDILRTKSKRSYQKLKRLIFMRDLTIKSTYLITSVLIITVLVGGDARAVVMTPDQKKLYSSGVYQFDIESDENNGCSGDVGAKLPDGSNEEKVWALLSGKGLKPVAVAGIMGNFVQESAAFDPASKQNGATRAIPIEGDNHTGFGLAQWTSKGRQALLFKEMKKAGLQKYLGADWGHPENNKDIPIEDIDKLLIIEINFAWDGDTTKIKDIANQLNNARSTKGDKGSAILFHDLFERSGDSASMLQERVDSASGFLEKYAGSSELTVGSCSTGELGGVATIEDALPWAKKFMSDTADKYNASPAKARLLGDKSSNGGSTITIAEWPESSSFVCWGAYGCDECTTLSGWFVTAMTDFTYGGGNGGEVVGNLKAKGVPTGSEPKPFSVFSTNSVGGSYGHTGVVLGVLNNGEVIALENNNGANLLKAYRYKIKERYPDVKFAYVGDKLKDKSLIK